MTDNNSKPNRESDRLPTGLGTIDDKEKISIGSRGLHHESLGMRATKLANNNGSPTTDLTHQKRGLKIVRADLTIPSQMHQAAAADEKQRMEVNLPERSEEFKQRALELGIATQELKEMKLPEFQTDKAPNKPLKEGRKDKERSKKKQWEKKKKIPAACPCEKDDDSKVSVEMSKEEFSSYQARKRKFKNQNPERNLKFSGEGEEKNFTAPVPANLGGPIVREALALHQPDGENMRPNSRRFRFKKYLSHGYTGDSLPWALLHSSNQSLPNSFINSNSWYYEFSTEIIQDQRLDTKINTRSNVDVELVGTCYVQKLLWKILSYAVTFIFLLFSVRPFIQTVEALCKTLIEVLLGGSILFNVFLSIVLTIVISVEILFVLSPVIFSRLTPFAYDREYQLDVRINVAHLCYGKRQNIDLYASFLKSKLRDKDYYPASLASQSDDHKVLVFVLEKYLNGNLITYVEDIRPSDFLPSQPGRRVDHLVDFQRAPDDPTETRCYNIPDIEIGDINETCVPPITKESLKAAYEKRIRPTNRRPACSEETYDLMRNIGMCFNTQTTPIAESMYEEYAQQFADRKGLSALQREMIVARARVLDEMDDLTVLECLRTSLRRTSWFIKNEVYAKTKQPSLRYIINPELDVKLIFGAHLSPIEHSIYNDSVLTEHLIKGKSAEMNQRILNDRFGQPGIYIESDYSSFESSIRHQELRIEFEIYARMTTSETTQSVLDIVCGYLTNPNKTLTSRNLGSIVVDDMRLSGFPNTSVGNAVLNYLNFKVAENTSGIEIEDFLVEGDDALVKLACNTDEEARVFLTALDSQRFIARDTQIFHRGSEASFCGMKLVDGQIEPTELQRNKLSIIFSKGVPSNSKVLALSVARLCCYYAKYPTMRDQIVTMCENILSTTESAKKLHSSDILKLICEDYRVAESNDMKEQALDLFHRIIRGDFTQLEIEV